MKYSRSAITQLTRWYKQVLIKCAILNAAMLAVGVGTIGMAHDASAAQTQIDTRQVITEDTEYEDGVTANNVTHDTNVNGGVFYNESTLTIGGTSEFSNSTFTNNSAANMGGAIYNTSTGTMTINGNSTFSGNKVNGKGAEIPSDPVEYRTMGGAVYNEGTMTIANGTFTGNQALGTDDTKRTEGGAIFNKGTLTVGGIFGSEGNGNSAQFGGALYNRTGTLNVSDGSTFAYNSATGKASSLGGAIYNDAYISGDTQRASILNIGKNVTFESNSATNAGSAIYSEGVAAYQNQVNIDTDATFKNNSSTGVDGAILLLGNNKLDIKSGATFTGNTAKQGAAISAYNKDANGSVIGTITGATFLNNTATSMGGAILLNETGSSLTFTDSSFTGNTASVYGGAIYAKGQLNINAAQENVNFSNNTGGYGGAIANFDRLTINATGADVNFSNNTSSSEYGGAILNYGGTLNINATGGNVTFSDNTANNAANDIINLGTLNLNASEGKTISFAGGIDGSANHIVNMNAGTDATGKIAISGYLTSATASLAKGELHLAGVAGETPAATDLTGSTISVANNAIINTIDNLVTAYTNITLADGAIVKGDINFDGGESDQYVAASDATINYSIANLIDTALETGTKQIQVASNGSKVSIDQSFVVGNKTLTLSSIMDGTEIVNNGKINATVASGIDAAANATEAGTHTDIDYELAANEPLLADHTIKNSDFSINGEGVGKDTLELQGDLTVDTDAELTLNDLNVTTNNGKKLINNNELSVNDSLIAAEVANNGAMEMNFSKDANIATEVSTTATTATTTVNVDNGKTVTWNTANGVAQSSLTFNGAGHLNLQNGTVTGNIINNMTGDSLEIDGVEVSGNVTNVETGHMIWTLGTSVTGSLTNDGLFDIENGTFTLNNSGILDTAGTGAKGTLNIGDGTNATSVDAFTNAAQIKQNNVNIKENGSLKINIAKLAYNTIDNDGMLELRTTANSTFNKAIGGDGTTKFVAGEDTVTLGSDAVISQAVNVASGTLSTSANNLGGAVTNAGTLELTAGTLANTVGGTGATNVAGAVAFDAAVSQDVNVNSGSLDNNAAITGAVTVAAGAEMTSTLANAGTLTNNGTFNLEGALGSVNGTGSTVLQNNVTAAADYTIAGTLDVNGKEIDMTNATPAYNTLTAGVLTPSSGTLKIDINAADNSQADKIATTSTTTASTGTINVTDIAVNGATTIGTVTHNIITNAKEDSTLALALGVTSKAGISTSGEYEYDDVVTAATKWSDTFNHHTVTGATLDAAFALTTDSKGITTTITAQEGTGTDTPGAVLGDTLAMVVQAATPATRTFMADSDTDYTVTADLGTLGGDQLSIIGTGHTAKILGNEKAGITMGSADQTLNITDVAGMSGFNGAVVDNTAGGTVNISGSTIGSSIVNDGEATGKGLFLSGTNSIASIADSAGTGVAGKTTISGGSTTVTGSLKQNNVAITAGTLSIDADKLTATSGVANDGTLELTGGTTETAATSTAAITGNGTTSIKGIVANSGSITNDISIAAGGKLSTSAANISDKDDAIANAGILELTAGELTDAVSGAGHTDIAGTVSYNAAVNQQTNILSGALTASGTNLGGDVAIANGAALNLSGAMANDITGYGATPTYGALNTADGTSLATGKTVKVNSLTVADEGTLTNNATTTVYSTLTNGGTIANAGTLNLNGGTTETAMANAGTISGTGTTNINGIVANTGSINGNDIVIAEGGKLSTSAASTSIADKDGSIANAGKLELTAGTLAQNVTGAGSTDINGDVAISYIDAEHFNAINQGINVLATKKLTANAASIGGAVANAGTLELTGGTLAQNVTGYDSSTNGIVEIAAGTGTVAMGAGKQISDNNLKLTSGIFDLKNVTGATSGDIDLSGLNSIIAGDGTLSVQDDGKTGTITLGNVDTATGNTALKVAIDAKLSTTPKADKLVLAEGKTVSGTKGIVISALNITADPDKTEFEVQIAEGDIMSAISLADNVTTYESGTSIGDFLLTYDKGTGIMTGGHSDLYNAIISTIAQKNYNMKASETFINPAALGGTSLTINGGGYTIGAQTAGENGIRIANSDQILSIKGSVVGETVNKATISGFGTAINNAAAGTVNLENVTMTNNTLDLDNRGTLNLTGENSIKKIAGDDGITNVNSGKTTFITNVEQGDINVAAGAELDNQATVVVATLDNAGTLNNLDGASIKATTGITNAEDATISTKANGINGTITNDGKVELRSGYLTAKIKNSATPVAGALTEIAGDVTVNDADYTIAQNASILAGGELTAKANFIGGAVANAGTLNLSTGTLAKNVTGTKNDTTPPTGYTSETNINGQVVNNAVIDDDITIAAAAKLTTAAGNVTDIDGIANAGTLELTGGDLATNVNGNGHTDINGTVTINDATVTVAQAVNVVSGTSSLTANTASLGGAIANAGTLTLTGGDITNNITGYNSSTNGVVEIAVGDATIKALADVDDNKLKLTSGTLDMTAAADAQGNIDMDLPAIIANGGTLSFQDEKTGNIDLGYVDTGTNTQALNVKIDSDLASADRFSVDTGSDMANGLNITSVALTTGANAKSGVEVYVTDSSITNADKVNIAGGAFDVEGLVLKKGADENGVYLMFNHSNLEYAITSAILEKNYTMEGNETFTGGYIQMKGNSLVVNGEGKTIYGKNVSDANKKSRIIMNGDNQTLTVNDATFSDMKFVVNNRNASSTLNLNNVTLEEDSGKGIYNTGTMNLSGVNSLTQVRDDNATVVGGQKIGIIGVTNVLDGTTTMTDSVFEQAELNIAEGAKFVTKAHGSTFIVSNGINNDGTLELKDGTLTASVSGAGHTDINGTAASNTIFKNNVDQNINVISGQLTSNADYIGGNVANADRLTLTGGTLAYNVSGDGLTNLQGNTAVASGVVVTQSGGVSVTNGAEENVTNYGQITANVEISSGSTLTNETSGVIGLPEGTSNYQIINSGALVNKGSIRADSGGVINNAADASVNNSGTLSGGVTNGSATVTGVSVTNTGTIYDGVTNYGTLENTGTAAGASNIYGGVTNYGSVANSGTGSTNVGNIGTMTNKAGGTLNNNEYGVVGNLTNEANGTVNNKENAIITNANNYGNIVNGGLLTNTYNSGSIINNNGTTNGLFTNAVVNYSNGEIITDAGGFTTLVSTEDVKNDGLITLTGGTLARSIISNSTEATGTVEIAAGDEGVVVVAEEVEIADNNLKLTSGTLDVTNVTGATSGDIDFSALPSVIANGGALDVQDDKTGAINLGKLNTEAAALNIDIDVNLGTATEVAKADVMSVITGSVLTNGINIRDIAWVDDTTGNKTPDKILVADDTVGNNVSIALARIDTDGGVGNLLLGKDYVTGQGTYLTTAHSDLENAIISTINEKAYLMGADESVSSAADLTLGGKSLAVTADGKTITGGAASITMANANQSLSILGGTNGATITGFSGAAIDNTAGGTVTLENVTMSDNGMDVKNAGELNITDSTLNDAVSNTGTMNLAGTNSLASVSGTSGVTNVNSGETTVTTTLSQDQVNVGVATPASDASLINRGTMTANRLNVNTEDSKFSNKTGAVANIITVTNEGEITNDGILNALKIDNNNLLDNGAGASLVATAINNGGKITNAAASGGKSAGTIGADITNDVANAEIDNKGNIDGDITNMADLNGITIKNDGIISGNVDNGNGTDNVLTNLANGTITGGTVTNTGGTIDNTAGGMISSYVVNNSGDLKTLASQVTGGVKNDGALELSGTDADNGKLGSDILGTGTAQIVGAVNTNAKSVTQNTINIGDATAAEDASLTNTGTLKGTVNVNTAGSALTNNNIVDGSVNNNGTVTNNAGATISGSVDNLVDGSELNNAGAISGAVNNVADATVNNTGSISGLLTNEAGGLVNTTATGLLGGMANDGLANINGGTLNSAITGTGTSNILADTIANSNITQGDVNIGDDTTDPAVNAKLTNNAALNATTLDILTAGSEFENGSNGTATISGAVTNKGLIDNDGTMSAASVDNDMVINNDGTLTTTSDDGIVNDGLLINDDDGSITGGTIANNSGAEIDNIGTIAAAIDNAVGGVVNTTADGITGGVDNDGELNLNGGALGSNVEGEGTTNVYGNTSIADGKTLDQATVNVGDDDTLGNLVNNGTLKADTLNVTEDSGFENASGKTAELGALNNDGEVDNKGTLTADNITNNGEMDNSGTMTVTNDITNNGILDNAEGGIISAAINNAIAGAEFTNDGNVEGDVTNVANAMVNNSGTITGNVENDGEFVTAGNIGGNVNNNDGGTVANTGTISGNVTNDDGAEFTNAGTVGGTVNNSGDFDNIGNGTINGNVTNNKDGDFDNDGTVKGNVTNAEGAVADNSGTIEGGVTNAGDMANSGEVKGNVDNSGEMANSGTVDGNLTNSGAFNNTDGEVKGSVENAENSEIITDADKIATADDATISNDGALDLTGGTLSKNIEGNGTTYVNGNVTIDEANPTMVNQEIDVESGSLTALADSFGDTVVNDAIVNLTGGTLSQDINGSGKTNINGDVIAAKDNGNIANANIDKAGSLDIGSNTINSGDTVINGLLKMNIEEATSGSSDYVGGKLNTTALTLQDKAKLEVNIADDLLTNQHGETAALELVNAPDGTGFDNEDIEAKAENTNYTLENLGNGTYKLINDDSYAETEVAAENGTPNNYATAEGWDWSLHLEEGTPAREVQKYLNAISRIDAQKYVDTLTDLAPADSMVHVAIAQSINNQIDEATAGRKATAEGASSGDEARGYGLWAKVLYSDAKQNSSRYTAGFKGNMSGIALGLEGHANENTTLGIGYAYDEATIHSLDRKTDTNGHTFFLHGKYQPSKWYARGLASYTFSKYKEQTPILTYVNRGKYDVENINVNAYVGYDFSNGITPEGGLRYLRLERHSYTDTLGQDVKHNEIDLLTGVLGVKYAKDFVKSSYTFTPKARLAATYDIISSHAKSNVRIGDNTYAIRTRKFNRYGVEFGLGAEFTVGNWNLSAEYELDAREKFHSNTGMLKAKYNF